MSELFEVAMVLSFGAAWPASIAKSLQARSAKGKSLQFLMIIDFGYICGILSKVLSGSLNYVVLFYILNFLMVSFDMYLYFRNRGLDRQREREANEKSPAV